MSCEVIGKDQQKEKENKKKIEFELIKLRKLICRMHLCSDSKV